MKRLMTLLACSVAVGCAVLLSAVATQHMAWALEDESDVNRTVEVDDDEVEPEELERRLDEIERLIDQAESGDDDNRVRELRREGERLLDRLEEFERARLEDDEDHEEEDRDEEEEELERHARRMELHRMDLEVERLSIELEVARQEAAVRLAQIATDEYASKAYALTQLLDGNEEPDEAAELMVDLLEENEDEVLVRIIRLRLARLYRETERPGKAREELRKLILGKK